MDLTQSFQILLLTFSPAFTKPTPVVTLPNQIPMYSTVSAKRGYMRSDGRFFVPVDALTGEFARGDTLIVAPQDASEIRLEIHRIYFVANNSGAQKSLVFKDLDPDTAAIIERTIGDGCVLTVHRCGS